MTKTKTTKKDYFEQIITLAEDADRQDIVEFAQKEIEALERKAAKAKERAADKKAEADTLTEVVAECVTDEFETIADIAARVLETGVDATISKISYRLNKLAKEVGSVEKGEVTVKDESGKSRKLVAYRITQ